MANENKLKEQQDNTGAAESNAERDQDHGNMNNGTIGGSMGIISSAEKQDGEQNAEKYTGSAVAGNEANPNNS